MYEWDEAKRKVNLAKHGVDFAEAEAFDWSRALTEPQAVRGEARFSSMAPAPVRLHVMIWTPRRSAIRVISLRKANEREARKHADAYPAEGG